MERPATTSRMLRCGGHTLPFSRVPLVMGILNVTPDSFSDGGRFAGTREAIRHARAMAAAGADLIDVGGESTRPGSEGVSVQAELDRVIPVIEALTRPTDEGDAVDVPISIDTTKPEVARAAVAAGAGLVNDVSAASDPGMPGTLGDLGDDIAVVLMHMKGTPRTMQKAPRYDDVVDEVSRYLRDRATELGKAGVAPERIVVDPGIGFGKRLADNLDLLKNIDALRTLGYPVLIGGSRKSFVGMLLDRGPDERICGSLAVVAQCYHAGAEMVRVHDVRETVEFLRVLDAIHNPDPHRGTATA